ncbi:MAG: ABC-F family ATP-binding cassette domain-containing protein, partial [Clostridiales bacterium]|nr:ABC-F family ATP-binding cassette domain-containing protein [Clostridiales bacterium]
MIILTASDVTVEYGTDVVLSKINFSINEGDRLGIVGVNGAGKSTLLRIIAGEQNASRGDVFISKGRTVGMLEQNAMLESDKTIYEEMLVAFDDAVRTEARLSELEKQINEYGGDERSASVIAEFSSLTEHFKQIGGYEYKARIHSMLEKFGFEAEA